MDLLKILKKKSKQYEIDKKEGEIADKMHQRKIEKQEEDYQNLQKLKEKTGYTSLFNKIRNEMINKGFKGFDVNRETYAIIGVFDPKKKYHEKNIPKTKKVDNSQESNKEEYNLVLEKYMKKYKKNKEKAKEYYGDFDNRIDYSKYLDDNSDDEEEIPVKRTRMKTKIVDNSKAQEKRNKIKKLIDEEPKLQETTSKLIDNIIKGIEEKLPPKPKPKRRLMSTMKIMEPEKKRPMSTMKIMEPEKKKRGRPPIPQEEKDKRKLEKAQKATEERERKQEEKEYTEREKNRQEYSKKFNAKEYIENKAELKKLKKYMRAELETGGNDKKTVTKYNDLKRRIKEYEDKYINNVV